MPHLPDVAEDEALYLAGDASCEAKPLCALGNLRNASQENYLP